MVEDDVGHPAEKAVEQLTDHRRFDLFAHRREADDVAEHDRDVSSRGSYRASFASIATRSRITMLMTVRLRETLVGTDPSRFRMTRAVSG